VTASRDASVVTVLGESVMTDTTDTTEGSEVSRDGCDSPPRASPRLVAPARVTTARGWWPGSRIFFAWRRALALLT
jgi:hypothetical protein